MFITRLREQRYPTRRELDEAAPDNPVVFATGPDASLNTLALKLSGIDKDFKVADGGPGYAEKDEKRRADRHPPQLHALRQKPAVRPATDGSGPHRTAVAAVQGLRFGRPDHHRRPRRLSRRRSTAIASSATTTSCPCAWPSRITSTPSGAIDKIQDNIRRVAEHPLSKGDDHLRIIGIKTYLDGGMLTGSAYMRKPWGVSKIYSIKDPDYRGVLFIPKERLLPIVQTTVESGLQFTAHSVGDGAVHTLVDVYEELSRKMPIRKVRPVHHALQFHERRGHPQDGRSWASLADIQPAWLYLDTRTLTAQFGYDRLRYFQPLKSLFEAGVIAGGGSDHMQKIGSLRSVNPYNPFLGMWTTITRKAKWYDGRLHPEEALSREQAIRFYTVNNAYILFLDDRVGSLEAGKLADFIVLDRDLLTCPVDDIKDTQSCVLTSTANWSSRQNRAATVRERRV